MSIPTAAKTKNGTLKYILKKALRGVIPDDLIDRKKQGFGVPIHEWLLRELGSYARRKLETFVSETDLIDGQELQRLFLAHRRARNREVARKRNNLHGKIYKLSVTRGELTLKRQFSLAAAGRNSGCCLH